jgi:exodeoxyribonuclease VII large subunit
MQLDLDFHQSPDPSEPKILSVSELTRRVRELLERGIGDAWVEGEISNYRRQSSGHQYFTLKDKFSQLPCVLFSGTAAIMQGLKLADGQQVQVFGILSVYEPRGQYQLIVRLVQARGQGSLQAKFEALKQKLSAEGLFDPGRKRPLPRFPNRVGLVTSPTGAAIRDFLKVLHRRHPGISVLVNPVRVQGRGASLEIARAIREFGNAGESGPLRVDVIVITRGGGSIEDLWEFNEELVARAIAASPLPVVSAIGHEIDFTIADFVADLRAPTPSAAAEILAADRTEVLGKLAQASARLARACDNRIEILRTRLDAAGRATLFRDPLHRVAGLLQTLDRQAAALERAARLRLERARNVFERLVGRMFSRLPLRAIADHQLQWRLRAQKIAELLAREMAGRQARLERALGVLRALDPQATLRRGYTITMAPQGYPLVSAAQVEPGMVLRTRFQDGEAQSIAVKR